MEYRRFESPDRLPVYRLFRESLWDYMLRFGIAEPGEANDVDEFFRQQQDLYQHLEQTASEDWVAQDDDGSLVGWARSIERDGHLQLTHFFVATSTQGKGVGRGLLDRAFAPGRGKQRSIIATNNPSALSLYLRYDVTLRGVGINFFAPPREREFEHDLELAAVPASAATLAEIVAIDSRILGYRRPAELEFFMHHQPALLFSRGGKTVAYAFASNGYSAGPAGADDPADLPALLNAIEASACAAQQEELWVSIPAAATHGVDWALASGYRIYPFYEMLLSKQPSMQLDRFIMTNSGFVW